MELQKEKDLETGKASQGLDNTHLIKGHILLGQSIAFRKQLGEKANMKMLLAQVNMIITLLLKMVRTMAVQWVKDLKGVQNLLRF